MIKFLLKYCLPLAVLWTVIIFVLCSTPGRFVPTTSWLELLSFDKFVHASIFFTLVCLWLVYWFQSNKLSTKTVLLTLILSIVYGGLLEIMQATLFSQRSGDWFDFIANSFGCVMGLWFFSKIKQKLNQFI
jgi:VanZ family protein